MLLVVFGGWEEGSLILLLHQGFPSALVVTLSDHQYGFRSNRSTSLAVMEFVENIATAIDKKQYAVGVFVDLCKEFDPINHSLLLQKLEHHGIKGKMDKKLFK